jgi:N-methylhydantoinase A
LEIGIDIGGTFTDGVVISGQEVLKAIKVPTCAALSLSIEKALKQIMEGIKPEQIQQITLSTTLMTNLVVQNNLAKGGLLLIPGPGANPHQGKFPCAYKVLRGGVDYRGRIIEPLEMKEVEKACTYFLEKQVFQVAVACKFSQRNPALEKQVVQYIQKNHPEIKVLASHRVSGLLNWVRRANGAYFTLTTREDCAAFQENIKITLKKLGLQCPVFILKADGGTLPLEVSLQYPLETIFSGPVASTLGALACTEEHSTAVVIDMGGTTTDLALLLDGKPLLAERGAFINDYPVPVRSLAVTSLALGGDTPLLLENKQLVLGKRQGSALCLGGPVLTVTDLLVYLGYSDIASPQLIAAQVEEMASALKLTPQQFSDRVLALLLTKVEEKVEEMFKSWAEEPAYRIWQVLSAQGNRPQTMICLGGPAQGLGEYWRKKKKWKVIIPAYASVANAIGAALAIPTLKLELFADTERNTYTTSEGGRQGVLPVSLKNTEEAKEFALELFRQTARERQLNEDTAWEILYEEGFHLVRGWQTTGKIFQIGLQTVPGIRTFLKEEAPYV